MGDIVPIHRCRRCGASADSYREVEFGGKVAFTYWCCTPCWEETRARLSRDRSVFLALIAMGVKLRVASDMMIAKRRAEIGE